MPGIMSEGSGCSAEPQVCSTASDADRGAEVLGIGGDRRAASRPLRVNSRS